MSPEDWKTYWRTCHLTPFQIQGMERQATEHQEAMARQANEAQLQWARAHLRGRHDAFQREIDKIITEKATELTDRMELQMMGIKYDTL